MVFDKGYRIFVTGCLTNIPFRFQLLSVLAVSEKCFMLCGFPHRISLSPLLTSSKDLSKIPKVYSKFPQATNSWYTEESIVLANEVIT